MKTIRIGSRDSKLAVIQSEMVKEYIESCYDIQVEIVKMKTTGDRILDRTLDQIGGKGLFVKELDTALRDNRSDLSVHSLKDMPMEIPDDLPVIGYSRREDPRDVLVLPDNVKELDLSKPIGCSSKRRVIQVQKLIPHAVFESVRGNVLTRLRKLDEGQYGALILAAAGLKRLGLEDRISRYFPASQVVPSAGQGILALQGKKGEDYSYVQGFLDQEAYYEAISERAFVKYLNGGCSSPIGAYSHIENGMLKIQGIYYDEMVSSDYITGTISGPVLEAESLGIRLAVELKNKLEEGKCE